MFDPLLHEGLFEAIWDHCVFTAPRLISSAQVATLAGRFVGCNLVLDVAEVIDDVLHNRNIALAPTVTASAVHQALSAGTSAPANGLVSLHARNALDRGPDANHPWRRINLWLVREALVRVLQKNDGPTAADAYADECFQSAFPTIAGTPTTQGRMPAVVTAYHDWWNFSATRLQQLLTDTFWPRRAQITFAELVRRLADELDPKEKPPLRRLLAAKNGQAERATARRANWRFLTIDELTWFEIETGVVLNADESGDGLFWGPLDLAHLRRILTWLDENRPINSAVEVEWKKTNLWAYASGQVAVTDDGVPASEILLEWELLQRALWQFEGAKEGAAHGIAEDLFFAPSPDFAAWRARMALRWP